MLKQITEKGRKKNKHHTTMIDPDDIEVEAAAAASAKYSHSDKRNTHNIYETKDDYTDEPDPKRRKTSHKSYAQLKGEEERRKFAKAQEEMFKDERAQSRIDHIKHLQKIAAERSGFTGEEDGNDLRSSATAGYDDDDDGMTDASNSFRLGEKDTWTGKDEDKRIRGGVEEATLDEEGHIAKLHFEEDEEGDFDGDGYKYDGDIRIEPFNLKKERETGYFDESGFYIENSKDKERDPWLDEEYDKIYAKELRRPESKAQISRNLSKERQTYNYDSSDSEDEDDKENRKCAFLQKIVSLLTTDTETVSDGLRRLGNKKSKDANIEQFNELTDAADGLLELGNMGIYAETKASLLKALSVFAKEPLTSASTASTSLWEYKFENGDGTIQGPFTSQQMAFWQAQGFFSGPYAALVRPAKEKTNSLLDDLEEDENGGNDFVKSDTIDFSKM